MEVTLHTPPLMKFLELENSTGKIRVLVLVFPRLPKEDYALSCSDLLLHKVGAPGGSGMLLQTVPLPVVHVTPHCQPRAPPLLHEVGCGAGWGSLLCVSFPKLHCCPSGWGLQHSHARHYALCRNPPCEAGGLRLECARDQRPGVPC